MDIRLSNEYPIKSYNTCRGCGGPHTFDTSIESKLWNKVVRDYKYPELLCVSCIIKVFTDIGEEFVAKLYCTKLTGYRLILEKIE